MASSGQPLIQTGGGAVFTEPLNAGNDINIYHITNQIHDTTQDLYIICKTRDVSQWLRNKIIDFTTFAAAIEERAKRSQTEAALNDPELNSVLNECKDVLADLNELKVYIQNSEEGSKLPRDQSNRCENMIRDIRTRLCLIQSCLNSFDTKNIKAEYAAVQMALQRWAQEQGNKREGSIRSFHTAHSIPVTEREQWHDIEKSLRQHGLTPQLIQQHLAFITESIEDSIRGLDYDSVLSTPATSPLEQFQNDEPLRAAAERMDIEDYFSLPNQASNSTSNTVDTASRRELSVQANRSIVCELGFTTLADPTEAIVDIIFIHSILGHPERSWTSELSSTSSKSSNLSDGFLRSFRKNPTANHTPTAAFWPADFVPEDFQCARVLTYGYHAVSKHFGEKGRSLLYIGKDFLERLAAVRFTQPNRPVLFVAHGVGGLVLKAALRYSQSAPRPSAMNIDEFTRGIIFMGTPHRGVPIAKFAVNYALLLSLAGRKIDAGILRELKPQSGMLEMLEDDFGDIVDRKNIPFWTFQESLPHAILREKVTPDWSSKVGHRLERVVVLHADGLNMCKFSGKDDVKYAQVHEAIRCIVREIECMNEA